MAQNPKVFSVRMDGLQDAVQDPSFVALLEKGWFVGFTTETYEIGGDGVMRKMVVLFPPKMSEQSVISRAANRDVLLGIAIGIGTSAMGSAAMAALMWWVSSGSP